MTETAPSSPDPNAADAADGDAAADSVKETFRAALARKTSQNSHVEQHLGKRGVGSGNNDTHKRQFRRKSG